MFIAPVEPIPEDAPASAIIAALEVMQSSTGWAILTRNIKANIAVLENQIIDKKNEDGAELSDADIDRLRDRRNYLVDLGYTPFTIINGLKEGTIEVPQDDPYPQNEAELKQMNTREA